MIDELGLNADMINSLPIVEVMPKMVDALPGITDQFQATRILWDMYNPWVTWIFFGAIGLASTIAMLIYHFWLEADKKKKAAMM